ncbi:MAG: hypothetical protein K2Y18_06240 [Alphaproteobacteria bacterium]|jgi:hypothetical protein|nr:hypothetical protein [Alphaproteobacteria bacterium]
MKVEVEKEIPPVRSRAYRCLARFAKNYHSLLPDTTYFDSEYAKIHYPVQLEQQEYLIGVYENMFGTRVFDSIPPEVTIWDNLVITDRALNLCSKFTCEKIYFKEILEIEGPKNKEDDLVLHIHLQNRVVDLAILYTHGENGVRKDVFLWWQFLKSYSRGSRQE